MGHNIARDIALATKLVILWTGISVYTSIPVNTIPSGGHVTYARIVVNFCPQKKDPNCVQITTGGNLIYYPGELTTRTADLTTSKIL